MFSEYVIWTSGFCWPDAGGKLSMKAKKAAVDAVINRRHCVVFMLTSRIVLMTRV
jgi:hypothetical protein